MQNQENEYRGIKSWSYDERPREKMLQKGASSLSNAELLAILIATGTQKQTAIDLARLLLAKSQNSLLQLTNVGIVRVIAFLGTSSIEANPASCNC